MVLSEENKDKVPPFESAVTVKDSGTSVFWTAGHLQFKVALV